MEVFTNLVGKSYVSETRPMHVKQAYQFTDFETESIFKIFQQVNSLS